MCLTCPSHQAVLAVPPCTTNQCTHCYCVQALQLTFDCFLPGSQYSCFVTCFRPQIQTTILPQEKPLVQQKLSEVEVALQRGCEELNWRVRG